jgi:ubiquinone/menaquinone biosynthesis C-methylase UbiE
MRSLVAPAIVAAAMAAGLHAQRPAQSTVFAPEDLGVLESPDREQWQRPEAIMDALGIADGSRVADLGAGGGWFTVRLGHRVGPNGRVFAEDIQSQMLDAIARRVKDHGLTNIELIRGTPDDPKLPPSLDAVLVVDTYTQFPDAGKVTLLRHVRDALAPSGRLGVVDFRRDGAGGPGPPLDERIDPAAIRADAAKAGLTFLRVETCLRYQYLLIFGR